MLLILIKDLVKKGHSAVLKNLTSLVAQARPQAFSLFWGNLTARELRLNLVPRVLSYTQRRVSGMREPRERGWLRSRSSLRTLTYFRSSQNTSSPSFSLRDTKQSDGAFLAWGDFHASSRFGRSTIPNGRWWTTRSLGRRFSPPLLPCALAVNKSPAVLFSNTSSTISKEKIGGLNNKLWQLIRFENDREQIHRNRLKLETR